MFDPMSFGFLAQALAQNPDLAGILDQQGIPAPGAGGVSFPTTSGLGANLMPGVGTTDPNGAAMPGGAPGAAPAAPGGDLMSQLNSLKGIKAPEPVKPIMSAGVSGAQKAPEVKVAGAPSMAIQALLAQAMGQGRPDPLRVPGLGPLLRGGRL